MPEIKSLGKKRILDLGCGLGFFSIRFLEKGARVLSVDIDKISLEYLQQNYNIQTQYLDLNGDAFPYGEYDLIFIGDVLEHIYNPYKLLLKAKQRLAPFGIIVISTPALEGPFIHTKGKRLGHNEGSQRHERDGFWLQELKDLFNDLDMNIKYHAFCIYNFGEIFMQLTKFIYLRKNNMYKSQSDVICEIKSFKYKILRLIYPIMIFFFNIEGCLGRNLRLKGHSHILIAQKNE